MSAIQKFVFFFKQFLMECMIQCEIVKVRKCTFWKKL